MNIKPKPRFSYYCKDCGHIYETIWVLRFCTKCKSKNIVRTNLRKQNKLNGGIGNEMYNKI